MSGITATQKARLKWHCRRGMLELDLLLARFCEKGIDQINPNELEMIEHLLETPDPELLAWLMGDEKPSDQEFAHVVRWIQSFIDIK
jgi:antitoxin CptB